MINAQHPAVTGCADWVLDREDAVPGDRRHRELLQPRTTTSWPPTQPEVVVSQGDSSSFDFREVTRSFEPV
jgi:hypothetical protein